MYHHTILSRDEKETVNKVYRKQKSNSVKGDRIKLLEKDFDFIGIQMNEEKIMNTLEMHIRKKSNLQLKKLFSNISWRSKKVIRS